jgi:hypothetical protein
VIAFPPFHAGAMTLAVSFVFPETNKLTVGAFGIVYGIAERLADSCEFPAVFLTTTATVYEFPLSTPEISYDVCPTGPKYEYVDPLLRV